jgi:hypothetical protein
MLPLPNIWTNLGPEHSNYPDNEQAGRGLSHVFKGSTKLRDKKTLIFLFPFAGLSGKFG